MNIIPKLSLFAIASLWISCCLPSSAQEEKSPREIETEEALVELKKSETELKNAFAHAEKAIIGIWGEATTNRPLKDLQESQQAWLKWRDIEANVQALEISGGGYTRRITAIYQKAEMNQARANKLRGNDPIPADVAQTEITHPKRGSMDRKAICNAFRVP